MAEPCQHRDVHFEINHQAFDDINVHYVELKCTCRACGKRMLFRGCPFGVTPAHPTMAIDGGDITLPMVAEGEELRGQPISFVGRMIGGRILPRVPKL